MPANKDFKRLVRGRMQKTGESYTSARVHLLTKQSRVDYAKVAGISDASVKAKTGCNWERWVMALDYAGAHAWPHREIAEYVHKKFKVPDWWSQTVTVGYERIKGLRAIGQRLDGHFETNKSKTFAVSLGRLYRACIDGKARARWLPGVALTVRTATRNKSMRMTWPDKTWVQLGFIGKGARKSQVAVQHGRLADKAAATKMKAFWEERFRALAEVLGR